jgi:hypothetical protein
MKLTPVGRFGKDISKCSGCEGCPACHTLCGPVPVGLGLVSQYPSVAGWAGTDICVENKNMAISPNTIRSIPKDIVRVSARVVKWQNSSFDVLCRFHRYLLTDCQCALFLCEASFETYNFLPSDQTLLTPSLSQISPSTRTLQS